jgi:hypothetical protein
MMTSSVYICALEQKIIHEETTTKDHKHQKEEVLASMNENLFKKLKKN